MSYLSYYYSSHRHLPSFPTRRSSDLSKRRRPWTVSNASCPSSMAKFPQGPSIRAIPAASSSASHSGRSEEHTSELQSHVNFVCRLLLEKKKLSYLIILAVAVEAPIRI